MKTNFDRAEIERFKLLNAKTQREHIIGYYQFCTAERMRHALEWADDYATDLLDPTQCGAVVMFDLWFIVTQIYDVDLPNDVAEIIAEEQAAGRGAKAAQPWRNFLVRHQLDWRKFTKKDLAEIGLAAVG